MDSCSVPAALLFRRPTSRLAPVPSAFEYAAAPESREIVRLEERYGLFIGGEFVEPRSGEFHRTSASMPEIQPVASATVGW